MLDKKISLIFLILLAIGASAAGPQFAFAPAKAQWEPPPGYEKTLKPWAPPEGWGPVPQEWSLPGQFPGQIRRPIEKP